MLHEHGSATGYETTIEAAAPTSAASAESIRDRDLRLRPYSTPEDILRVVPGLVIAQHQGGGKADQLFLRGFDADHGTDVALSIDGIPINLPSHAHGQGYADLHFLIPEVIDRVDVLKGPYFVEVGDFATAGAVNLRTRRSFAESSVQATYGSFDTWRVLGIGSTGCTASPTWMAAEVYGTQGPFQAGEDLKRYNLFLKSTLQISASTRLGIVASAYGSGWRSSGQFPSASPSCRTRTQRTSTASAPSIRARVARPSARCSRSPSRAGPPTMTIWPSPPTWFATA
jgi:outer membrane receptor for Fe3+-dicitrate